MEGFEVIGTDDHKVGEVVAAEGDVLIVEEGLLRKTRHAIPLAFAHADDGERVVRLTISKELVDNSPALQDHDVDRNAVMEQYGRAEGYPSRRYTASSSRKPARDSAARIASRSVRCSSHCSCTWPIRFALAYSSPCWRGSGPGGGRSP